MDLSPDPESREPRRSKRPLILAGGGLIAVLIGVAVAFGMFKADPADDTPPPAAEGGLKIEMSQAEQESLDPARPLRCFVEGEFVGELTLAKCAQRNGVAAQGLDVGLDASGALAAAVSSAPPVNTEPLGAEIVAEAPAPAPDSGSGAGQGPPAGECLRHTGGEWRTLGDALTLDTCVQVLFAGRCEPPGGAQYGRWNGEAIRLVTGRVEIAPDGANFRPLVEQDPRTCMFP